MKRILLLLLPIFTFSQELPLNFSDASHQFVDATGGDAQCNLIQDPTDSNNTVAELVSNLNYSTIFELVLETLIDVTNSTNNSISFDYYSTETGIRNGLLRLDDEQYGGLPIQVAFSTSGNIGWETITVDFDNAQYPYPDNGNSVTLSNYGKLVLILDNGNPPSVSTCYIDNVVGAQNGDAYNILYEDVILTTQQEVNDFGAIGYSKILGSLKIISDTPGVSSDITDLSPLNSIHYVGRFIDVNNETEKALEIKDNNNLISLEGLNNLKTVIGSVIIKDNSTLNSLSALNNFNTFTSSLILGGDLIIENNDSLTSLNGLGNLPYIPRDLYIVDNDMLLDISLNNIVIQIGATITDNLSLTQINGLNFSNANVMHIKNNPLLTDFSNITGVLVDGLIIDNNDSLTNLNGLGALQVGVFFPTGGYYIRNNDNLTTLNGLSTDFSLIGLIELENNQLLSDINILSNFYENSIRIINNNSITSLSSLSNYTGGFELIIEGNNSITDLTGLESVAGLNVLRIRNTPLNSINQLSVDIGCDVTIENNQNLTSLDIFTNDLSIGPCLGDAADVEIINNNGLTSLIGFENVVSLVGRLKILNNDNLADFCAISQMVNNVETSFLRYEILYNSYNPTQQDIIDGNCSTLGIDDFTLHEIKLFPNPTKNHITIKGLKNIESTTLYNMQGQKINIELYENKIDLQHVSSGIYFLNIKTTDGIVTKKITKQ